MMIAARNAFLMSGAKPWTNPYITDGLVAMWDGEWNAGGGAHDASATVWRDLSSSANDAQLSQWATWASNAIVTDGVHYAALADAAKLVNVQFAELVYSRNATTYGYVGLFANKKIGQSQNSTLLMMAFKNNTFMAGNNGQLVVDGETLNASIANAPLSGSIGVDYYAPKIYVNGAEALISSGGEAWNATTVGEIGGRYARINNVYSGMMHCVRVYSRALTAAEVAANYAVDAARFGL